MHFRDIERESRVGTHILHIVLPGHRYREMLLTWTDMTEELAKKVDKYFYQYSAHIS
jgi:hypothetical protein